MAGQLSGIGRFTTSYLDPSKIVSDEHRLFSAHRTLANKGHDTEFPLEIEATFAAPFAVAQKGKTDVLTLHTKTTLPLSMVGPKELSKYLIVETIDEDGSRSTIHFKRRADDAVFRSTFGYDADSMPAYEYLRQSLINWGQASFASGVAEIARSQMFDRIGLAELEGDVRRALDHAVRNLVFVAYLGGGEFMEKCLPPRLQLKQLDRDSLLLSLKLADDSASPYEGWANGLTTMPAELAVSTSRLRYAVMNTGYAMPGGAARWNLDEGNPDGWDDEVRRSFVPRQTDIGELSEFRDAEHAICVESIRSLAREIAAFRSRDGQEFSTSIQVFCAGLAAVSTDVANDPEAWDGILSSFETCLDNEAELFSTFMDEAGWIVPFSPFVFARAKFNLLASYDLEYRLRPTEEEKPAVKGMRK